MLKTIGTVLVFGMGASFACSGTSYFLKGEETEPGVFNVLRGYGWPASGASLETIGTSTIAEFKAHVGNIMASNSLVFIGAIDSIIGDGRTSASAPGLVPDIVLAPPHPGQTYGVFYARLKIDTLFKGSLPSKHFWFQGYGYGSSCAVYLPFWKAGKFMNFSNGLDSMTHLRLPKFESFCSNCPTAHWFDGRYLSSPDFPVLKLDITSIYPTYPATGILRPKAPARFGAPTGKAYHPDGRRIEGPTGRKTPAPLLGQ
jgi:hypothetical protein